MIAIDDIGKYPIMTNKLKIEVDFEKFFSKYSIVTYYHEERENNLAYEHFADAPCLSVTGLWGLFPGKRWRTQRFFVLTKKGEAIAVRDSLCFDNKIRSKIDDLSDYQPKLKKRIIASLAINSLGKAKKERMMYNNGVLLINDDRNFLISAFKKELVCLKIEVNEYLLLTAKTTSFSHPKTQQELHDHRHCVFQIANDLSGEKWCGVTIKPIVVKKEGSQMKGPRLPKLNDLFIEKKRYHDDRNIAAYWPYNPTDFQSGKLFAMDQVVELVNKEFKDILTLDFEEFKPIIFDQYRPDKDVMKLIKEYFKGKSIFFENTFNNPESEELIEKMKTELNAIVDGVLIFPTTITSDCMVIKLVEPIEENGENSHYTKSSGRLNYHSQPLQHKIFHNNKKEDKFEKTEARRILMDLLVKECNIRLKIPSEIAKPLHGWEFIRYKISEGTVKGAAMSLSDNGQMHIEDFGFSTLELPMDFQSFAYDRLHYNQPEKIKGPRDYYALKKDGHTYLIIDTEEIPILDADLIREAYGRIINDELPLSFFKRKYESYKYCRGYVGLKFWLSDGLDGEPEGSYSYIAGFNNDNMQIKNNTKMLKVPRARTIFPLTVATPELVDTHIREICDMLKFGFGRWNEVMTYPIPFKFLIEHLDNAALTAFSCHWSEITSKKKRH